MTLASSSTFRQMDCGMALGWRADVWPPQMACAVIMGVTPACRASPFVGPCYRRRFDGAAWIFGNSPSHRHAVCSTLRRQPQPGSHGAAPCRCVINAAGAWPLVQPPALVQGLTLLPGQVPHCTTTASSRAASSTACLGHRAWGPRRPVALPAPRPGGPLVSAGRPYCARIDHGALCAALQGPRTDDAKSAAVPCAVAPASAGSTPLSVIPQAVGAVGGNCPATIDDRWQGAPETMLNGSGVRRFSDD